MERRIHENWFKSRLLWIKLLQAFEIMFYLGKNSLKHPFSIWRMQFFLSLDKKWDERMLKWAARDSLFTARASHRTQARASSHERVMDQTAHITWIMTGASSHPHLKEPRLRDLIQDITNADITNARYGTLATSGAADESLRLRGVCLRVRARATCGHISPICFSVDAAYVLL